MKKIILILMLIITPVISNSGDLNFVREDLKFTIEDDCFVVDGIYYFNNLSHKTLTQGLLYTFPIANMGKVDSIYVFDLDNKVEIPKRKVERFGIFSITLNPLSSGKIRIYYRQQLESNYCKYVFKSTNSWNRPVDLSNFRLELPKDYKLDSLSYTIDSTGIIDKNNVYYWEFKDFSPTKDFELWFHKSK